MQKSIYLKALAILGVILVSFWLPLRLIGLAPSEMLETQFDLLISVISAIHVRFYFQQPGKSWKELGSWWDAGLVADLLTLIPISLVVKSITGEHADHWLLLNFLTLRHVKDIKPFLDHFPELSPLAYRLVPILAMLPPVVHGAACGWIALGSGSAGPAADHLTQYIRAVYWTMTTLCTVGYGDIVPKTSVQMLYAGGIQLLGVGFFGYILSNVASVLGRQDAAREHHMNNLDRIETFMRMHDTPRQLRNEVRGYYHYLWTRKKGYLDRSVLADLPTKIQSDLFLHLNQSILQKVPFLRGASQELIEDLMRELEPQVAVPGERLFRVGDGGDALYFIQSGEVEIVGADRQKIATLSDGDFFGEMALVSDRPRKASARSVSFCDLYVLRREAFDLVISAYPEFREHIQQVARTRSGINSENGNPDTHRSS
ncbi:hypothetical protein EBZ37_04160 [bacterium]|nr:hypothetical protein [bacterium]